MLISLALVAPGLLFLNYAIEKCSILWPNFQAQFWTQCNCFFPFCGPIFRPNFGPNFRVQLWHLPIFFSYKVSNSTPKLDPKMGPKLPLKIWPQIAFFPENLATDWIFFQLRPSRIRVAKPTKARKANIPHSMEFYWFFEMVGKIAGAYPSRW